MVIQAHLPRTSRMKAAIQVIRLDHAIGDMTADHLCEHPNHNEYIEAFLRKFPTAKRDAQYEIVIVDLEHWYIPDDQKKNTVKCCQVCSISEDIKRASSLCSPS
jgi:hypothetical protein